VGKHATGQAVIRQHSISTGISSTRATEILSLHSDELGLLHIGEGIFNAMNVGARNARGLQSGMRVGLRVIPNDSGTTEISITGVAKIDTLKSRLADGYLAFLLNTYIKGLARQISTLLGPDLTACSGGHDSEPSLG
jgi:hypothetical protein